MTRPRTMAISSLILYVSAVAIALISGRAAAQDAPDICSCSPSKYTFTLDFSLTCPPVSVTRNPGITATFCSIVPFGDANETIVDLVPTEVEAVDVIELGQSFEVLSQTNITGSFVDGDTFDFSSITDSEGYDGDAPKVLQLHMFGFNALRERIVNFYAISFSNICDTYPSLVQGDSAGWTAFTTLESPSAASCPAVPVAPTEDPVTVDPTESPVVPTEEPVPVDPTEPPVAPTESPITMSMDLSVDDIVMDIEEVLMSMEMSLPTSASSRAAQIRLSGTKSYKSGKKSKDKLVKFEKSEKSEKADKLVKSEKADKLVKSEKSEKSEKADKLIKSEKSDKSGKSEKSDKSGKSEKLDKSGKSEKSDKSGKSEKSIKRRRLRVRPLYQIE